MRATVAIGCVALAALGCSSGGGTGGTGGAGGAGDNACTGLFFDVTGDGLPQMFTTTSGREITGTLVLTGSAAPPGDATITLTLDELGSTKAGHVDYRRGTEEFTGDQAAVTITSLGAVGEAIEGSYMATAAPATVGITLSLSGTFKVCRGADGTM